MPFFALVILIEAGLIVHCLRTGRNTMWIWVLAMLPCPGTIAYLGMDLLPEIVHGRTARRAAQSVKKTLDPTRDLREAHKRVRLTGSIDDRRRFADELFATGKYQDAIENYRAALTGLYAHDPHLMLGLARAHFANN